MDKFLCLLGFSICIIASSEGMYYFINLQTLSSHGVIKMFKYDFFYCYIKLENVRSLNPFTTMGNALIYGFTSDIVDRKILAILLCRSPISPDTRYFVHIKI